MTIWEYLLDVWNKLLSVFKSTEMPDTETNTTTTETTSTGNSEQTEATETATETVKTEAEDDLILGSYLNPNDSTVKLTEDYFKTLKNIGYDEIYVGIASSDVPTKLKEVKAIAGKVGLAFHAWVWPTTTKLKDIMQLGINVHIDLETYSMADYIDDIKEWVTWKNGGLLSICIKPDGWDGDQKISQLVAIDGVDFIAQMEYTDFFSTTDQLNNYLALYNPKFNGKLASGLSTYWSDSNTSTKTNERMNEEINTAKKYTKRVILFRAGTVCKFTGLIGTTSTTNTTTTTTATSSAECDDNAIKNGCQGDNVKTLQTWLNNNGFGTLTVDGDFGDLTETAVKKFQTAVGISSDGVVGPVTRAKMDTYTTTSMIKLSYTADRQNNNYQCGPSSWKMACSVFNITIDEDWLAKQIGTTSTNGTDVVVKDDNENIIAGMLYAPTVINPKYGTNLSAKSETFDSWEKLRGYLAKGNPIILRVKSWKTSGEHYVMMYGLDIANEKAYLGDPSWGKHIVELTDLRERIRKVSSASIIVVSK